MSRTPIPDHLLHKPEDVEKNGKLFDEFVELFPAYGVEERELVASQVLESIRQKVVVKEGVIYLPFGMMVKRDLPWKEKIFSFLNTISNTNMALFRTARFFN